MPAETGPRDLDLSPEQESPELEKSEEVARRKLEIVNSPETKNYGVRFVSKAEYEYIMQNHDLQDAEVCVMDAEDGDMRAYIDGAKIERLEGGVTVGDDRWYSRIYHQSKWEKSALAHLTNNSLLENLRMSHQEIQKSGVQEGESIVDKTYANFREKFIKNPMAYGNTYCGMPYYPVLNEEKIQEGTDELSVLLKSKLGDQEFEKFFKNPGNYSNNREDIKTLLAKIKAQRRLLSKVPRDDIELIKTFFTSEHLDKRSVRDFIKVYSKNSPYFDDTIKNPASPAQQYEVALLFSENALHQNHSNDRGQHGARWDRLYSEETDSYRPQDHLLGAVVIIADKEKVDEFVQVSNKAGEWSHPVFDRNGAVKFPKNK